jgi:pyruvate carboxylase
MQCHATTGLSTATNLKCIEAGIDNIDTAISSMSMTYGHSPTEALVAILEGTERDTGLDLERLERIAGYFRGVRKKVRAFEGSLRGTDSRILVAQVPGRHAYEHGEPAARAERCGPPRRSARGDPGGARGPGFYSPGDANLADRRRPRPY